MRDLERLRLLAEKGDAAAREQLLVELLRRDDTPGLQRLAEQDAVWGRTLFRRLPSRGLPVSFAVSSGPRVPLIAEGGGADLLRATVHRARWAHVGELKLALLWDEGRARLFVCDCVEHILSRQLSFSEEEEHAARQAVSAVRRSVRESVTREEKRTSRQAIEHHAQDRSPTAAEPFRGVRAALRAAALLTSQRVRRALGAVSEAREAAGEAELVRTWLEMFQKPGRKPLVLRVSTSWVGRESGSSKWFSVRFTES